MSEQRGEKGQPAHADVWERNGDRFTVMTVCDRHVPPHVSGYWWTGDGPDPCEPGAYPLPRFLKAFTLVEREDQPA